MKCALAFVFVGAAVGVALGAAAPKSEKTIPHIIGGDRVNYLDRQYTVRLMLSKNGNYRYCGSSRLDPNWFVTAAECLDTQKYDNIEIRYPADLNDVDQDYDTVNFHSSHVKIIIHPEYNNVTKVNNIALFRVACEDCLPAFKPVPDIDALPQLPQQSEQNQTFSGLPAVVAGWTITNLTVAEQKDNNITSFETHIVRPFLCKSLYFFRVNSAHICASSWGGKRLTQGHVGAPLVVKGPEENSKLKLVGIASHIQPWATWLPIPTVFLNIAPYANWIRKNTGIYNHD